MNYFSVKKKSSKFIIIIFNLKSFENNKYNIEVQKKREKERDINNNLLRRRIFILKFKNMYNNNNNNLSKPYSLYFCFKLLL